MYGMELTEPFDDHAFALGYYIDYGIDFGYWPIGYFERLSVG